MKIAIFDECNGKFTSDLKQHWEESHEVIFDKYFDPKKVLWADVCFFDWAGNNIQRASDPNDGFWKEVPQPKGKKVILRMHDIDLWVGQQLGVKYDWVNHVVFIAEHFKNKFLPTIILPPNVMVHLIKHGINTKKFTYREKLKGNKIAWIGSIKHHKNLELALQVLAENSDYELHVLGERFSGWEEYYVNEFVKRNNLKFKYYNRADVNQFLEDKDFLLLTSAKEGFSFVVGESMSKGIKPLIHNFPEAETIWPKKHIWNKVSEVRPMLEGEYSNKEYRQCVEQNYPLDKMLSAYDELLK